MSKESQNKKSIDNQKLTTNIPLNEVSNSKDTNKNTKKVNQINDQNKKNQKIDPNASISKDQKNNSIEKTPNIKTDISKQKVQVNKSAQSGHISRVITQQRLKKIKSQKQLVKSQIKQINKQLKKISKQQRQDSIFHKRQQISNNRQAQKMAINLIKNHRARKKQFEEKKKVYDQKTIQALKQQYIQMNKQRQNYDIAKRQQKRRIISLRLNQNKRTISERKQFDRISNQLVNKIIKEGQAFKQQKQQSPYKQGSSQVRIIERRPPINFVQLEKHESKYIQQKQQRYKQKQRSTSISYPTKRFQRNKWAQKLQEVQKKQKQQQKIKQLQKKMLIEKRLKYGQLIHSLFVKKTKLLTEKSHQNIAQNSKSIMITPNKQRKQSSTKPMRSNLIDIKNMNPATSVQRKILSPEEKQKNQNKHKQLRKQTEERLRKIQSSNLKTMPDESKYQSKYHNYLGQVKVKRRQQSHVWNNILNNKELTKEEKYTSILKKAMALQNKAKFKQSLNKETYDEVVDLYLDSIQAKLAVLQNIQ